MTATAAIAIPESRVEYRLQLISDPLMLTFGCCPLATGSMFLRHPGSSHPKCQPSFPASPLKYSLVQEAETIPNYYADLSQCLLTSLLSELTINFTSTPLLTLLPVSPFAHAISFTRRTESGTSASEAIVHFTQCCE